MTRFDEISAQCQQLIDTSTISFTSVIVAAPKSTINQIKLKNIAISHYFDLCKNFAPCSVTLVQPDGTSIDVVLGLARNINGLQNYKQKFTELVIASTLETIELEIFSF